MQCINRIFRAHFFLLLSQSIFNAMFFDPLYFWNQNRMAIYQKTPPPHPPHCNWYSKHIWVLWRKKNDRISDNFAEWKKKKEEQTTKLTISIVSIYVLGVRRQKNMSQNKISWNVSKAIRYRNGLLKRP